MSEYIYNTAAKEATAFTKQRNAAFAREFQIDLEDAYNSEVALARRGCLKKLDGFRLKDKTGNVVWDLQAYDFLKQQAVADTVHPSLWLNGKANIEAGVFEVLPGKIYQVRGIDVANLTFVRSKTGWIAIDVTTNIEAAAYGLRITEEVLGENIHDNIKAVIISHSHADHFGGIKGIVSPQQVGKAPGQVRIYVPAGFDEETIKECLCRNGNVPPLQVPVRRRSACRTERQSFHRAGTGNFFRNAQLYHADGFYCGGHHADH